MGIEIKVIKAEKTYSLRHQVMWPNKPFEYIKLKNDGEGIHLGLFKDLSLVSVVSIFEKDNCVQFRKFATKTTEQGKGYGSYLFKYMIDFVFNKRSAKRLWCNARSDRTLFYERLGMKQTCNSFVKGGINFIIMEKLAEATIN